MKERGKQDINLTLFIFKRSFLYSNIKTDKVKGKSYSLIKDVKMS